MNLGGTEKSWLNLLEVLPQDVEVDLLLLEAQGALINDIPASVNVFIMENAELINQYIAVGSRRFGIQQIIKGQFVLFIRCMIQYLLEKIQILKNPYWAIQNYVKPLSKNYDIAVAYAGIHNYLSWYTLKNIPAKKKVLWVHFDIEKVISDFSFGKRYYHIFDQIFCVAENASKIFQKRFIKAKSKVFTFNNIINGTVLLKQAQSGENFTDGFEGYRILTLGRLSKEKGQMLIPAVVDRLKGAGVKFRWYLIGEGKLMQSLLVEIERLGLEQNLILLGKKMNPYAYLRECDLYVQSSFYEGDPVVLREAKFFQKPIVTTNFLSASNLINHNENGLIVEISEDGIYEGVKELLKNEELRNKFSFDSISTTDYEQDICRLITID